MDYKDTYKGVDLIQGKYYYVKCKTENWNSYTRTGTDEYVAQYLGMSYSRNFYFRTKERMHYIISKWIDEIEAIDEKDLETELFINGL